MSADACNHPSPHRKRPRTDSNSDEQAKVFTNHPSLYFEDGNVVLKCGWTLFCVHRTLLSKHSEVFRRMFTPVAEAKPQEFFRGCLLVALDDSADDMQNLLDIIYDGLNINFPTLNGENFPTIAGLLRMSTKYKLNRPRCAILDRLRLEWPSSLSKYDAKAASASNRACPPVEGAALMEDASMHPASVISLLRECDYDSPDLLAPLFYSLSTFIPQFISLPIGHSIAALSTADTERFIVGLNKLRCLHTASGQCPVSAVIHPPPGGDSRQSILCQYDLLRYWHTTAGPRLFDVQRQMCHPIDDWGNLFHLARADGIGSNARTTGESICNDCKGKVLNHIVLAREKMWDALPGLFGLN